METAELVGEHLGLEVDVVDGLHEHERVGTPFDRDGATFRASIAGLFERPDEVVFGNESASDALTRFEQALDDVLARYPTGNVAVVTHATVMSLYIARRAGVNGYTYWQRLGMPAFAVLSLPDLRLIETVESVA